MNTRFFKMAAISIMIIIAASFVLTAESNLQPMPFDLSTAESGNPAIPDAAEPNIGPSDKQANLELFPYLNSFPASGALDLGQMDEQAKLEPYPLIIPAYTGELDLSQMDERAKLEPYPLIIPAYTGELDLGQMDERAKLEPYPVIP